MLQRNRLLRGHGADTPPASARMTATKENVPGPATIPRPDAENHGRGGVRTLLAGVLMSRKLVRVGAVLGLVAGLVAVLATRVLSEGAGVAEQDRAGRLGRAGAGGASPLSSADFVAGAQAGELAVGLAVGSRDSQLELAATVLDQDGRGASGLRSRFLVRTAAGFTEAKGSACGAGCYRALVPPPASPRAVVVRLAAADGERSATFRLPARWPPPRADELLRQATRAYRGARSVVYDERLASGPRFAIRTRWTLVAPDRLAYRIEHGAQAVVIGTRRWDRARPGAPWRRSAQPRLRVPTPPWSGTPQAVRRVDTIDVAGRPVDVVSFVVPGETPIWFTVSLDRRTALPLRLTMVTAAHFMTQRYRSFNRSLALAPPRSSRRE